MKNPILLVASFFAIAVSTFAQVSSELPEQEKQELIKRAMVVADATQTAKAEPVIALTHPAIYQLTGGEEKFKALTRQAMESFDEIGLVFESYEIGTPTPLHAAGDEAICFLPTTAVLSVQGKRVKSNGYLVCIRPMNGADWKFLDGAGFKGKPDLLWNLFPALSRDVTPPEQSLEAL